MITLSSPVNATGLFELETQPELSLPFENLGVDTTWELRMPKAANAIDYRSIADVLMTIEYTALDSFEYRQQVTRRLDNSISADRPFSLRQQFPDQWYDLNNPDLSGEPMTVRCEMRREDFPPNLEELAIQRVLVYVAQKSTNAPELLLTLGLKRHGGQEAPPSTLQSTEGMVRFTSFTGSPVGEWKLTLPNTAEVKDRFKKEEIEDILFVITYTGRLPEWG
jgi:Tc toxin complex TcA C-terminal TcB-binding domain